jgi:hypothetical protein
MITSPARTAWPGRISNSREIPLRLLSSPITATRSVMGVVPGASSVTFCGISTVSGSASSWVCCLGSGAGAARQPPIRASALSATSAVGLILLIGGDPGLIISARSLPAPATFERS